MLMYAFEIFLIFKIRNCCFKIYNTDMRFVELKRCSLQVTTPKVGLRLDSLIYHICKNEYGEL